MKPELGQKREPPSVGGGLKSIAGWFGGLKSDYKSGMHLLGERRYGEAAPLLEKALAAAREKHAPAVKLVDHLNGYAEALAGCRCWRESLQAATESLTHLERANLEAVPQAVKAYELMAESYEALRNAEEAARCLRMAVDTERKLAEPDAGSVSTKLLKIGVIFASEGCWRVAKIAYTEAQWELESISPDEPEMRVESLMGLGRCEFELQEFGVAREWYHKAIEAATARYGRDSKNVSDAYHGMARSCQAMGDNDEAVRYFERVLAVRERMVGTNRSEIADVLMELAEVQTQLGNHAYAIELARQAVGRLEGEKDGRLATALASLGAIYFESGRCMEAEKCFTRAEGLWQAAPESHAHELAAAAQALEEIHPLVEKELELAAEARRQEKAAARSKLEAECKGPQDLEHPVRSGGDSLNAEDFAGGELSAEEPKHL